jgi:hypothetical protein
LIIGCREAVRLASWEARSTKLVVWWKGPKALAKAALSTAWFVRCAWG